VVVPLNNRDLCCSLYPLEMTFLYVLDISKALEGMPPPFLHWICLLLIVIKI